jgi:competence protein ComEC
VATAALVLVAAAAASLTAREIARRTSRDLVVTFLDVGQGDAAVLEMPGDRVALIDGGGTYDGSFDPGERVVEPFLRARGITRLDLVVLSHPHPDHLGGLHRVLGRFAVGELWTSGDDGKNPEYGRLLAAAAARGVATPVPSRRRLGGGGGGGVVWEPLGPFSGDRTGERIGAPEGVSVNDASLVVRVAYAGRSLLFTGDIEGDGEGELAGRTALGADVGADVLKVPHHGSRTSSSDELLEAVRPWMAVMSLGWQNRFHFPASEVLDRYRDRGIPVLRTDLHGAVTVTVGAGGALGARCARGCSATAPAAPVAFTGTSRPGAAPAFAPGAR